MSGSNSASSSSSSLSDWSGVEQQPSAAIYRSVGWMRGARSENDDMGRKRESKTKAMAAKKKRQNKKKTEKKKKEPKRARGRIGQLCMYVCSGRSRPGHLPEEHNAVHVSHGAIYRML
uniref:Uncharacterized protein n=1 Tax=Caenorhabditis japonica TaxID=281687 RepID=A0A8R1EL64_CAEJA